MQTPYVSTCVIYYRLYLFISRVLFIFVRVYVTLGYTLRTFDKSGVITSMCVVGVPPPSLFLYLILFVREREEVYRLLLQCHAPREGWGV